MKDTLRMMKPTCIEDIVALVALYRPGPMENIPQYCAVKNGKQKRKSQHPSIDHIVAETHGIIVYQEQVMQIAQAMAGYSLGGADLLRRAIGKKIKSAMDAEKPKFLDGAKSNGIDGRTANDVWELMARFAEYGFPKAHAAAYAVVSYQTAWLKTNHPVEFMAAVMTFDCSDAAKLDSYSRELKRLDIELLPPCVNRSNAEFSAHDKKIAYALNAVKGVGKEAAKSIQEARDNRPFRDLFDFASRVNLKMIKKRALEMLVYVGAFDELENNRHRVHACLEHLMQYSDLLHTERLSAQESLFGHVQVDLPPPKLGVIDDWNAQERLRKEYGALGFYLSGHPIDEFADYLRKEGVTSFSKLAEMAAAKPVEARIAGTVVSKHTRVSAKGNRFAFVEISDPTGSFEVTVFSEELESAGEYLSVGKNVIVRVNAKTENDQIRMQAGRIEPLNPPTVKPKTWLKVFYNDNAVPSSIAELLKREKRGPRSDAGGTLLFCPLSNEIDKYDAEIKVPGAFEFDKRFRQAIVSLPGVQKVLEG